MAHAIRPPDEKFGDFYTTWVNAQEHVLNNLQEAIESDMVQSELLQEVKKVVEHYEEYYKAKQDASHQDILEMVTPSWRSPLEKAFLWLGGWRPSLAFQLVYALAGQQIEAELAELLDGVDTPTFASLSSSQLSRVSELQTATNKEEENLSNEMAMLQQSFADQPLLSLAQAHRIAQSQEGRNGMGPQHEDGAMPDAGSGGGDSSNPGTGGDSGHTNGGDDSSHPGSGDDIGHSSGGGGDSEHGSGDDDNHNMDAAMHEKLKSLEEIAVHADNLRVSTLKNVLDILDPYQKAQYLISAGKLQAVLRNVGEKLNGAALG